MLNVISGLLAGGVAATTTSYESIATTVVGSGGSSTITFSSIPSTYKHLQIRCISNNGTRDSIWMRFNSDSGANYADHLLYGNGSAANATADTSQTAIVRAGRSESTANTFAANIIDILDYANTNKYKTTRTLGGFDYNGGGWAFLASGLWQSTSAISTITLTDAGGANFAQYSSFALYGIKG